MIELLKQIPVERALLIILLAGRMLEQFKETRRSQRAQGVRIGELEKDVAQLKAALEASGKRA